MGPLTFVRNIFILFPLFHNLITTASVYSVIAYCTATAINVESAIAVNMRSSPSPLLYSSVWRYHNGKSAELKVRLLKGLTHS